MTYRTLDTTTPEDDVEAPSSSSFDEDLLSPSEHTALLDTAAATVHPSRFPAAAAAAAAALSSQQEGNDENDQNNGNNSNHQSSSRSRSRPLLKRSESVTDRARRAWNNLAKNVDTFLIFSTNNKQRSNNEQKQLRQEFQDKMQKHVEFQLWHCLVALALYLGIAVVAYCFVFHTPANNSDNDSNGMKDIGDEDIGGNNNKTFTWIDAMYFAVVTFTTIGYGDLVPISAGARLFTCFFALSGVVCLGIVLGVIGDRVVETERRALERARDLSKKQAMNLFRSTTTDVDTPSSIDSAWASDELTLPYSLSEDDNSQRLQEGQNGHTNKEEEEEPEWSLSENAKLVMELLAVISLLAIFAAMLSQDPGIDTYGDWDEIGNAFYFGIITATTVGYGDMSPQSQYGRLYCIIFIPLAVGAMGHWISRVASRIMESRQSDFRRRYWEGKELCMDDIEMMDEDGDGCVSQMEFVKFMLIAMNKVDKETFDSLDELFSRLDSANTGTLSKQDLIATAKRRLRKGRAKLELARYKQDLIRRARAPHRRIGKLWKRVSVFASFTNNNNEAR